VIVKDKSSAKETAIRNLPKYITNNSFWLPATGFKLQADVFGHSFNKEKNKSQILSVQETSIRKPVAF
jgi:hypothetical protein